jgi:murein L,D-transpeptidase YcbB/YkuD
MPYSTKQKQAAWRLANKAALSAKRKQRYAEHRQREREQMAAYYEKNRPAIIARSIRNNRQWTKENPKRAAELKRSYANVRRYGITPEQYDAMLLAQNGKCAICEEPPRSRMLAIDHDHATASVRELLCTNCNAMLGHARDRASVLNKAIAYLAKHKSRSAA